MTQKKLSEVEGAAGDFIVHMESPQKCLTYGHVTTPAAADTYVLDNVLAYPLKANNVLAVAGEEASVVAFLIAGEAISSAEGVTTTGPYYTILDNFDGVVLNEDMLPVHDCATPQGHFNAANIKTALAAIDAALPKWVDEPEKQTEQTS